MKLYIAEKPSLGRAIADVLPKPHRKADGCIYAGNGDCVSWCVGHLLEQAFLVVGSYFRIASYTCAVEVNARQGRRATGPTIGCSMKAA